MTKYLLLTHILVWRMEGKALELSQAVVLKLASVVAVLRQVLVQTVRLTAVLRTVDQAIKTVILRLYCRDLKKVLWL